MAGSNISMHLLLLALCAGLTSCVLGSIQDKLPLPEFCEGIECPRFTVINTTKDYELRRYEASTWVITSEEGTDFNLARQLMFFRLIDYIRGKNDKNQRIEMTIPVLAKITPGPGPACTSNFTMGFYVDPSLAATIPKPTNPVVELAKYPEQMFYTKSFGGQADLEDFIEKVAELAGDLPADAKFDKSHFYRAQFNDPTVLFDRHNEVWLTAL